MTCCNVEPFTSQWQLMKEVTLLSTDKLFWASSKSMQPVSVVAFNRVTCAYSVQIGTYSTWEQNPTSLHGMEWSSKFRHFCVKDADSISDTFIDGFVLGMWEVYSFIKILLSVYSCVSTWHTQGFWLHWNSRISPRVFLMWNPYSGDRCCLSVLLTI